MTGEVKVPVATPAGRKRFWKQAAIVPENGGYAVQLDGRPIKLPERTPLWVESQALAQALAAEWQEAGQQLGGLFRAEDLPLTGIAGSMLERIAAQKEGVIKSLLAYAGSDLLCYRAPAGTKLAQIQHEQWDVWLQWCATTTGAQLETSEGVMPISQSAAALGKLRAVLEQSSPAELAALGVSIPVLGSFVLGLAAVRAETTAEALVACATLDERAQMERWGEDTAVTDRIATQVREVAEAMLFMALVKQG